MSLPTLAVTPGTGQTINTLPNAGQTTMANSLPTTPPSDLADMEPAGVPVTGVAMPAGGVGLKGWLSAIYGKLAGTLAVSLAAGTNTVGSIIGRTSKVAVAPPVTSGAAYTAGNVVGGLMTFNGVFDAQNSGILQSIRLRCKSVQTGSFSLYLFTAPPSSSVWTDKTAPAINAADIPALVGPFSLSAPDSGMGVGTTYELDGIGAAILAGGTVLYGVLVTKGTPTFSSVSDISVELTTLKD